MSKRIQRVEETIDEIAASISTLRGVIIRTAELTFQISERLPELERRLSRVEATMARIEQHSPYSVELLQRIAEAAARHEDRQPRVVGGTGGAV